MKVIKVKTLTQWRDVLKVLFSQGKDWIHNNGESQKFHTEFFRAYKSRYLFVDGNKIMQCDHNSFPDEEVIPAETFLRENKNEYHLVLVENIREWDNVLDKLFDSGHEWPFGSTDKKHHYWKHGDKNLLGLSLSGEIIYFNGKTENYISYEEFMDEKIYTVTKREMETLEIVKNHKGIGLLQAVSNRKSELAAMQSIGNGAIIRWIGGDESIKIIVEEPKWRLAARDIAGNMIYLSLNDCYVPYSTQIESFALTGSKEELAKYKSDFWTWEEVDE